jgi:hypothetical protein
MKKKAMISKKSVKNEILEIINSYGLNQGGGRTPAPAMTMDDFFKVFYRSHIRRLMTKKTVGDRVLLYKAPYPFAGDIIFRYPAHHYTYLHSVSKELELFNREFHLSVPAQKIILFSTGENIPPGFGPFSLILAFDEDFLHQEQIAKALAERLLPQGQLLHFTPGNDNFSAIKELLKPLEPSKETRGRKPKQKPSFHAEDYFNKTGEEPWKNEVTFAGVSGFLLFLFHYLSGQGAVIKDHLDYFAEAVSDLGRKGFTFQSHYLLNIYAPKKEVAHAAL